VFCFWYNTQLALQLLEKKQLLERYFNFLFRITSRFIQPDQCQRLLLGLASILRGNVLEYSEVLIVGSLNFIYCEGNVEVFPSDIG